jgi:hypothetical protein
MASGLTLAAKQWRLVDADRHAVQLRGAEQYLAQFGILAKAGNTLVVPATLNDVGSMIAAAMNIIRQGPALDGPSTSASPQRQAAGRASGLA